MPRKSYELLNDWRLLGNLIQRIEQNERTGLYKLNGPITPNEYVALKEAVGFTYDKAIEVEQSEESKETKKK